MGVVGTWTLTGFVTVLFVAGMQKIPFDLDDAARVDGAGAFHQFLAVTIPGLRHEITVAVVITGIATLRNFDVIYNLTAGGPGFSTVVPSYEVYYRAFVEGSAGTACALAVVLAAFIFAFAFIATSSWNSARDPLPRRGRCVLCGARDLLDLRPGPVCRAHPRLDPTEQLAWGGDQLQRGDPSQQLQL